MIDRAEETRMWVYGTECTLRPITAKAYLEARDEGTHLAEKFGGGLAARTLSLYACLIAKGAYEEDDPLFENGEAVLDALKAGEILEIAKSYEETELKPEPEEIEKSAQPEKRQEKGTESNGEEIQKTPDAGETETKETAPPEMAQELETQLWMRPVKMQHTDMPEAKEKTEDKEKQREIRRENTVRERTDRTWNAGENTPLMRAEIINDPESAPLQTGSERMRLYKISACIERDSRRYDNGFVRY